MGIKNNQRKEQKKGKKKKKRKKIFFATFQSSGPFEMINTKYLPG